MRRTTKGGSTRLANVLIVDDDLDSMELSAELLQMAGHRVRTSRNGEEGLRSLSDGTLPDCLLLDVEMPVLNGPQMAHQMHLNDGGEEKIPILLVSGRRDLPKIAERMGTPHFLGKATRNYAEALLAMVTTALAERRAPASP